MKEEQAFSNPEIIKITPRQVVIDAMNVVRQVVTRLPRYSRYVIRGS